MELLVVLWPNGVSSSGAKPIVFPILWIYYASGVIWVPGKAVEVSCIDERNIEFSFSTFNRLRYVGSVGEIRFSLGEAAVVEAVLASEEHSLVLMANQRVMDC